MTLGELADEEGGRVQKLGPELKEAVLVHCNSNVCG
jgi:hypothetical protein